MKIEEIINSVPQLLLYFIPGFISLRMKEIFGYHKRHTKFLTAVFSILYSFIILVVYMVTLNFIRCVIPSFGNGISVEWKLVLKVSYSMFCGVILGWAITKLPRSKLGRWFEKLINPMYRPEQKVREIALVHQYGAFAYVHLKNGMTYFGSIGPNRGDPDDEQTAIALYDFTIALRNENATCPEDRYIWIKKKYKKYDSHEIAYIKMEDVIAVDVTPVSETEDLEAKKKLEDQTKTDQDEKKELSKVEIQNKNQHKTNPVQKQ